MKKIKRKREKRGRENKEFERLRGKEEGREKGTERQKKERNWVIEWGKKKKNEIEQKNEKLQIRSRK